MTRVYVHAHPGSRTPAARRVVQETRSWYGGMATRPESRWHYRLTVLGEAAVFLICGLAILLLLTIVGVQ